MHKVLNNKVLLFIVAILLLANIGMLLYFLNMRDPMKHGGPKGEHQRSPMVEFLQDEIGFNSQQMSALDSTRKSHRQLMKPLFEDIKDAKVQFYNLLTNPTLDESTFSQAASKIGEKQKLLDMQTFRNFREIRALCTPAQQTKYDSLIVNEISKMWFPSWKGNGRQGKDSTRSNH